MPLVSNGTLKLMRSPTRFPVSSIYVRDGPHELVELVQRISTLQRPLRAQSGRGGSRNRASGPCIPRAARLDAGSQFHADGVRGTSTPHRPIPAAWSQVTVNFDGCTDDRASPWIFIFMVFSVSLCLCGEHAFTSSAVPLRTIRCWRPRLRSEIPPARCAEWPRLRPFLPSL